MPWGAFCFSAKIYLVEDVHIHFTIDDYKRYYDAKTGVCVRQSQVAETPQGEQVINVDFSDYRTVDGVMLPIALMFAATVTGLSAFRFTSAPAVSPVPTTSRWPVL